MKIIYYNEGEDTAFWLAGLRAILPQADIRAWYSGDNEPADYALVWNAPEEMLRGRTQLKAIFNLAAGVDKILAADYIPKNIPILRLEDAGMGVQIAEYAAYAAIRHFRRFEEFAQRQKEKKWEDLPSVERRHFTVGVMGLGQMGKSIANALLHFGFPVRGYSRTVKSVPNIHCFATKRRLDDFLDGLHVLICALPLTEETRGILNMDNFEKLAFGACLVNLGRGAHLVEKDLLTAIKSGRIASAMLDVFNEEPLPQEHPFWDEPRITITPHIAAKTFRDQTIRQIAEKITAFERGEIVSGIVNREHGY